jgi:TRAP-type C4-dicarboxylate transport system permease small subunit
LATDLASSGLFAGDDLPMVNRLNIVLEKIEKGMTVVSWSVTLFITFMIVIDVFLRFIFNKPLPASWEISEVIMPYIVFFALARALSVGAHVQVTIVTNLLSNKGQVACNVFANLFSFCVCALCTYWSWLRFWESFSIREEILAAIPIPWWAGKFAMPVGMGIFCLQYLLNLAMNVMSPKEAV